TFRPADPCRSELRNALGVIAERARADDRVPRLDVHITDRGVVHGDPIGEQPFGDGARRALGVARVAGRPDRHGTREHRAISDTHDRSALLIDRDRYRRKATAPCGLLRLVQHRAHLILRADVPAEREQEKAADPAVADGVEKRAGDLLAIEARPHQRPGAELGHDLRRRRYRASVICPSGRPRGTRGDFSRVMRRIWSAFGTIGAMRRRLRGPAMYPPSASITSFTRSSMSSIASGRDPR